MISLNGNNSIKQPNGVRERTVEVFTDQESANGTRTRNFAGTKKEVELEWEKLTPTQFRDIFAEVSGGQLVDYLNDASKYTGDTFSFSDGLPEYDEDAYYRGLGRVAPFTLTLRES